jgi:hypothetical protein
MSRIRLDPKLVAEIEGLSALSGAELAAKYEELDGSPPYSRNRRFLEKRVAWLIQAREFGGLDPAVREQALKIARLSAARLTPPVAGADTNGDVRKVRVRARANSAIPPAGTVLVRPYKSGEVRVTVLDEGFEWDGQTFGSLSAVAKAITGSHCSGPAFFGLARRRNGQG